MKRELLLHMAIGMCISGIYYDLPAHSWTVVNDLDHDAVVELKMACLGDGPKATLKPQEQKTLKGPTGCCVRHVEVNGKKAEIVEKFHVTKDIESYQSPTLLGLFPIACSDHTFTLKQQPNHLLAVASPAPKNTSKNRSES
jgi:hypothetical protein